MHIYDGCIIACCGDILGIRTAARPSGPTDCVSTEAVPVDTPVKPDRHDLGAILHLWGASSPEQCGFVPVGRRISVHVFFRDFSSYLYSCWRLPRGSTERIASGHRGFHPNAYRIGRHCSDALLYSWSSVSRHRGVHRCHVCNTTRHSTSFSN